MSRKRDKPYFSRQAAKRRRPLPEPPVEDMPTTRPAPPSAVVVMGLSLDCSVLDLKSRFEIYGPISRIRIDGDAVGYVTYRNKDSADAAIAAGLDPHFGITVNSKKVQVLWATDPLAMWREGVGNNKDKGSTSKLVRAEVPLSRHGRGHRLASAIGNTKRSEDSSGSSVLEVPFRGREIVAYDDILINVNRTEQRAAKVVMEEDEQWKKSEKEDDKDESQQQRLWSWGAGTEGQLGTNKLQDDHFPQLLHQPSLSSISSLACGGAHVIALTSGIYPIFVSHTKNIKYPHGKVLSWGRGNSGQLGHGKVVNNALYPKTVTSLDGYIITHVSAGWSHSGFVSDTGCLFTCGDGSFGQLGHGDYASHCSPIKVSCFVNQHVAQVACGMRHSLVLLKDCPLNQVYGFGSGKRGQLGVSKDRIKSINLPKVVSGFEDVEIVEIAANGDHSAAVSVDGHLYTWGRGFKGFEDAHFPQCLNTTLNFTKATLGWNHALAMTGEGEVYMVGGNHLGVLSDLQNMSPPKQLAELREARLEKVPGLDETKIADIATGAEHSVLVTENGELKTWGWGEHGQLGLGDTCDRISPVTVNLGCDLNEATSIRVYCGSGFTFALSMP
ncbi:ultraviolet-B receptor UVR8-like [Gastrolobium bilobum]|uniref:ultraviolet-B receptor UVR8-like n=1 Tax=Gastrolobium bilobum TaxID=150636 RepID=UPI002AB266E1|nr:ultraviolet-B receptor UVR8-like [Gastrolobium bilobum]